SQELEQSPQSLIIQEGENFTINCHSSKPVYALHWYRQKNSEGLISLMILWENGEKSHEKTTATLNEKKQQSSLHITASQSSDSGIYFCAADTL
uniref:T cell receptor alpha variable 34 n=3 Tax=Canis lupus TaxID=9612 RepID=A0A8C0P0I6_CANLF